MYQLVKEQQKVERGNLPGPITVPDIDNTCMSYSCRYRSHALYHTYFVYCPDSETVGLQL